MPDIPRDKMSAGSGHSGFFANVALSLRTQFWQAKRVF